MKTSYKKQDVIVLLKDVTSKMTPLSTEEREKRIQQGIHYSEMLPLEYSPSKEYMTLYYQALHHHSKTTAQAIMCLGDKILSKKGNDIVLVSLARAGTPIGILLKRYFEKQYHIVVPHYTISIIRGRGIDKNAMQYILKKHHAKTIQFVDGWIGKGAIIRELQKEVLQYKNVSGELAVLADPAHMTSLYGTTEDFLIPSACLNAVVSGLFSRTIYNKNVIGENDFHGAVYYKELEKQDISYHFIEEIEKHFDEKYIIEQKTTDIEVNCKEAEEIAEKFHIKDINFIKPGIGETTRVLLRRVPWKILVKDKTEKIYIGHILELAKEKGITVEEYPLKYYRACGLIKNLNADI